MKVKATKLFEGCIDKTVNRPRHEGEVFDAEETRAILLEGMELVEIIEKNADLEKSKTHREKKVVR